MARLFTSGFELNSLTTGLEFDTIGGAPTISNSTYRSGSYSLNAAASSRYVLRGITTMASGRTYWVRFYLYIGTGLSANNPVSLLTDGTNYPAQVYLNTDNTLALYNETTKQGSSSAALSTGTWYRVEYYYVYTSKAIGARIDGASEFATGTATGSRAVNQVMFGIGTISATGSIFFDDCAVNDDQGTAQNSYPGSGKVICLRPSGAGDSASWTRGGTDSGANWSQCNNTPPNDGSYVLTSAGVNTADLYAFTDSGIGASDTVNVVEVGGRCACSATTSPGFKFQIEKTTGGTLSQSAEITPNSTSWRTNTSGTGAPHTSPIILYADPDGSAWTQSTLDTLQAGVIETTDTNRNVYVGDIWVIVDYTPSTGTLFTQSITGGFTSSGAIPARNIGARRTGGITSSGVLSRTLTLLRTVAGGLTSSGALLRSTYRTLTAGFMASGVLTYGKALARLLTAGLTQSGTLVTRGLYTRILTAGLTLSGTLSRIVSYVCLLAGGLSSSGSLGRIIKYVRALTAGFTSSGTLSRAVAYIQELAGGLAISGSISRAVAYLRSLSGGIVSSGNLLWTTQFARLLTAGLTFTGDLVAQFISGGAQLFSQLCEGGLTASGDLFKGIGTTLIGGLTATGSITKMIGKFLSASLSPLSGGGGKSPFNGGIVKGGK